MHDVWSVKCIVKIKDSQIVLLILHKVCMMFEVYCVLWKKKKVNVQFFTLYIQSTTHGKKNINFICPFPEIVTFGLLWCFYKKEVMRSILKKDHSHGACGKGLNLYKVDSEDSVLIVCILDNKTQNCQKGLKYDYTLHFFNLLIFI